ncbi:Os03g0577300, partial [Oryza sativa Japonica Group]
GAAATSSPSGSVKPTGGVPASPRRRPRRRVLFSSRFLPPQNCSIDCVSADLIVRVFFFSATTDRAVEEAEDEGRERMAREFDMDMR